MQLRLIGEGNTFLMPWRPPGRQGGKVLRNGLGSVYCHVPMMTEKGGWDYITLAPTTEVEPCDPQRYKDQGFGEKGHAGRMVNRSSVESPVSIVHRLCSEMRGAPRDEIVKAAVDLGVNISTAKTQYYAWKKLQ